MIRQRYEQTDGQTTCCSNTMASHGKNKDYESILFVCVLADLSLAVEAEDLMTDA